MSNRRKEMTEKDIKELNEHELKNVVGGSTSEDAPNVFSCGAWEFTGFVGKYAEGHIGESFYLVNHDGDEYYYGRLLDSFEVEFTFSTERTQVINCYEHNGTPMCGVVEVSGDDYWLYRERIK